MLNHDSLAIAAIFRDEFDYLLEWFAWHQIAGFKKFFIADNGSTDGTVALLEALGDLGIVDLIYQPVLLKRSQNTAYPKQAVVEIAENDTGCLKKREFIKVGVEHLFLNKKKIYCPIPKSKICHTILEQANYITDCP